MSNADRVLPPSVGRGIYCNMKTAVNGISRGKKRDINPRF
jgi:hypothetical protein